MFRDLSISVAAALLLLCPPAPAATRPVAEQVADLVTAYERASRAVVGVSAVDLDDGKVLASLRADEPRIPASNQKLLTSAFALARLGAGFRFATGVFLVGEDLVVAGDGDPTLGDPVLAARAGRSIFAELDRWAAAVRAEAGERIRHVLVCPEPRPAGRHEDWPADQRHKGYSAPVSTLNFHDNCFDVTFVRVAGGISPVVQPESRYIRIVSRLKAGKDHLWSLRTTDRDATVILSGTISGEATDPLSVAVDHPALLLGRAFAERLIRASVTPTGEVREVYPREVSWSQAKRVCVTTTPLFVAMRRANKRSLNMAAEAIFLRAGDGTWSGSAEMMARTLRRAYGLPAESCTPADGSGFSRANRVSPAALTQLLRAVARREDALTLLLSLPVGGMDGTLANRFEAAPCRGRIVAKTGTIRGVSCLSGYVLDTGRGVRIAFSILVNEIRGGSADARTLQERICRVLVESIDEQGRPATTQP